MRKIFRLCSTTTREEISRVKTVIALLGWFQENSFVLVEAAVVLGGGMFSRKLLVWKTTDFARDVLIFTTFLPVWTLGMDFIQDFQPFFKAPPPSLGHEIKKTKIPKCLKLEVLAEHVLKAFVNHNLSCRHFMSSPKLSAQIYLFIRRKRTIINIYQ